jgi:hypothetical protein
MRSKLVAQFRGLRKLDPITGQPSLAPISVTCIGNQHFFNGKGVFPGITEVIDVLRLWTTLIQDTCNLCVFFVDAGPSANECVVGIGNTKPQTANVELVQMIVLPPHRRLHNIL